MPLPIAILAALAPCVPAGAEERSKTARMVSAHFKHTVLNTQADEGRGFSQERYDGRGQLSELGIASMFDGHRYRSWG